MESLEQEIQKYGRVFYPEGEVVFNQRPNHIYIVAQAHTNPDRSVHEIVPRVQLEIFRIGQHLIKNYDVFLLLPESNYREVDYYARDQGIKDTVDEGFFRWHHERTKNDSDVIDLFNQSLKDHIYAATLLSCEPNVVMQGAELGLAHKSALDALANRRNDEFLYLSRIRELSLLLNIPEVASREYNLGRIPNLNSMVTFGAAHIPNLAQIIDQDGVDISYLNRLEFVPLNYQNRGYGVAIIMPHGILGSGKITRLPW